MDNPRQPTCDSGSSQGINPGTAKISFVIIAGNSTRALTLQRRDKEVPWPLEFLDS